MRILVAGADGQVSRALAEQATAHEIVRAGRPELDITRPDSVRAAMERVAPQVVINAAAYTAVDLAESDAANCFAVNADAAGHLAEAAAKAGAAFIHLSTDYVFDGTKDAPYVEDDLTAPLGVYGRAKLAGEEAVRAAHPGAIIVRTAWVFHHTGTNFVRTMLRLAETRDEVGVVKDQLGCPTYASDLAAALLAIAERPETPGIFHAAGGGETNWHGVASAIFAETARRGLKTPRLKAITTAEYPTPARRPANSRLDGTKLAMVYGQCLPDWRDGLKRCLDRLLEPKGAR